jgi:hypothetical protein
MPMSGMDLLNGHVAPFPHSYDKNPTIICLVMYGSLVHGRFCMCFTIGKPHGPWVGDIPKM